MPTSLVLVSDTHGRHEHVRIPPCDILIHSGDFTRDEGRRDLRDFLTWLERQPAKHKVLVAGNHDFAFEKHPVLAQEMVKEVSPSTTYLQDSGCNLMGLSFWGSPYQPEFCNWAFNLPRGPKLKAHWDLIPDNVDVLVTHCPPLGYGLDVTHDGDRCGCEDLSHAVRRVRPLVHTFGHIHFSYGTAPLTFDGSEPKTQLYNSSICGENYQPTNKPWEIEL